MADTPQNREDPIRHSQNQLLYGGIKFSAAGSLAAAVVILYTFGPLVNSTAAWGWFLFITAAYLFRIADLLAFRKQVNPSKKAGLPVCGLFFQFRISHIKFY